MIRLTEEKMSDMVTDYHLSGKQNRNILAKSVAKAQLKKVVEWGSEYCALKRHSSYAEPFGQKRHDCPACWQALLEEVKDGA